MKKALLAVVVVSLLGACHRGAANPSSLLLASASGWTRKADVRVFPANNLWQYMDGGADKFVAAGVQETATADYRYQNKFDAVAEVYSFASTGGPGAMMDSEPAAGSQAIQLGDAGRLFAQTVEFRRGPYLVRVIAYDETPETKTALAELGKAINSGIK
jgi:hypothetical protein